jgi:L-asparagine transporter-like permease
MTAGEAADPQATIPRAVNNLIWRILFFYVGALLFIMMFVAWTSVGLTASPFVVAFQDVCIPAAPENVPRTTTAATSLTADANVPRGTFTAAR